MPHLRFKKIADPHISAEIKAECRAFVEATFPKDLDLFDEMMEAKAWGAVQAHLRGAKNFYSEHPHRFPNVTNAHVAAVERLLGQLQFTGSYRQ